MYDFNIDSADNNMAILILSKSNPKQTTHTLNESYYLFRTNKINYETADAYPHVYPVHMYLRK